MIICCDKKSISRDAVVSLWNRCFGDSEEYILFFLDNCPEYVCLNYMLNDINVAQLFLLPGTLNNKKCRYLYAACTDPVYRKQGIMEQLIEKAKNISLIDGYSGIFLVPATDKLYSYYSKLGFKEGFLKKKFSFSLLPSINNNINESQCSIKDLVAAKKQLCSEFHCFMFSDDVIEYTINEHLFNGGKICYFESTEGKTLVFYFIDKNNSEIIVKELLSDSNYLNDTISEYFVNYNAKNIYILSPIVYNNQNNVENYTKCGMCFPLDNEMETFLKNTTDIYAGMYLD